MLCKKCGKETTLGNYCSHCGAFLSAGVQEISLMELKKMWSVTHYKRIKEKTKYDYENIWKKFSAYYDTPFTHIRASDIQNLIDSNSHLSKSTLNQIKVLYSLLCKFAVNERIVPPNYKAYLYNSGVKKKTVEIFSDREIVKLKECADKKESRYWKDARIVMCLIFLGYRPNELFSITYDKIFLKEKFIVSGSKTEAGDNRFVPIPDIIIRYVSEIYVHSFIYKKNSRFLFQNQKGNRINLDNWRYRNFYPLMEELEINDKFLKDNRIKPYSARHTFASLCFRANVSDAIKIKMIGHTDVSLTNEIYTHVNVEQYRQEIEKIDKLATSFTLE